MPNRTATMTARPAESAPLPAAIPNAAGDDALYLHDADTTPDGSVLAPGEHFTKRWALRNTGNTAWGAGYQLVFVGGRRLGAPAAVPVPPTPPGTETVVTVEFVATPEDGIGAEMRSDWRLVNPAGAEFGPLLWTIVVVPPAEGEGSQSEALFPPPAGQQVEAPAGADATILEVARFWNRYGGLILEESTRLGIAPAAAVGVLITESSGRLFDSDGRMLIRFENHLFWEFWGKANPDRFRQHFAFDPGTLWEGHRWCAEPGGSWQPCHTDNRQEWQVLELARRLDDSAALQSISMGAAQIMGFNHRTVGYPTVQAMFAAFSQDAGAQLRALFRFMEVNRLVEAVRAGDYRTFAWYYNGSGQPDYYAGKMSAYASIFAGLRPGEALPAAVAAESAPEAAGTPLPTSPKPGVPLAEADPILYEAWRAHIANGFKQNETMFRRILEAFMNPYWTTVWMYRILFGVGVAAFVVAAVVALLQNNPVTTLIFGGLSVAAFLGYFVTRPLQALEENLQFITWLGIIYNTYWTTLVQAQNPATYAQDLNQATDDAIARIQVLMAKHAERSGARPGPTE